MFLSLWPFQLYFIPWILPTILRFLILFFRSYFCLIGPFTYISLYESLSQSWYDSPDVILCGWLGLKHQLTKNPDMILWGWLGFKHQVTN